MYRLEVQDYVKKPIDSIVTFIPFLKETCEWKCGILSPALLVGSGNLVQSDLNKAWNRMAKKP